MNKKSLFFSFLDKISAENQLLVESIKGGYSIIFENTTEEQVEQIKTKLTINQATPPSPKEDSLDALVPKEKPPVPEEASKLDSLA
jgi:hypothetical protein